MLKYIEAIADKILQQIYAIISLGELEYFNDHLDNKKKRDILQLPLLIYE